MSRVVHFEIHATDPDRLISFYSGLFGWTFQKWDGPMEYWVIRTGPAEKPGIDGGLLRRHGDAPRADASGERLCLHRRRRIRQVVLDRAVELGGTVALPLMPVPGSAGSVTQRTRTKTFSG